MKNAPLVSILTPCYNGGRFLDNYFDDIIKQDYPNCELIFMDDGSTDNTKQKVDYYKPLVEKRGYQFRYFFHSNIGLGGTIAEGIKYVKGDYVVWPDCDDRINVNWISRKVAFLEEHIQFGLVRTNGIIVDEQGKYIKDIVNYKIDLLHVNVFDDYLFGINAWLQPLSFMIRMSAFDNANPDRYIYPTRRGQDWQMLLPVMYKYPCGYLDEKLFKYVLHPGSLSSIEKETYEDALKREQMYYEIIENTLKHMQMEDKDKYLKEISIYYLRKFITTAFLFGEKDESKRFRKELKLMGRCDWKSTVKVLGTGNVLVKQLYRYWVRHLSYGGK